MKVTKIAAPCFVFYEKEGDKHWIVVHPSGEEKLYTLVSFVGVTATMVPWVSGALHGYLHVLSGDVYAYEE